MTRENRICAFCAKFSLKGDKAKADAGIGKCSGFDSPDHPVQPFTLWSTQACVMFDRASDVAPREDFVGQRRAREES